MDNRVAIIDYVQQGNSIYVNLEVFDAGQNKVYIEEIRFLGDMPYGDLLHERKSPLTDNCRVATIAYLKNYFSR
ncbi:hypothetical protein DHX103_09210 [Planococcus sp. X10-3]|uniref:hypothetical protein n=1 Tax=Planococcus sp. X10-3 TaxID=3061240 RepID=UPI003BB06F9C